MSKKLSFEEFKSIYIKQTKELYSGQTPEDIPDEIMGLLYEEYLDGMELHEIITRESEG